MATPPVTVMRCETRHVSGVMVTPCNAASLFCVTDICTILAEWCPVCVYNGLTFTRLMPGAECGVSGSGCALSLVQVDTELRTGE